MRALSLSARHVAALAAAASAGCMTALPPGTARTLPRGAWQVHAAQTDLVVSTSSDGRRDATHIFVPELGVRYGVTDRAEVGARLVPFGGALGAKFAVLRAPSAERGIDLAIAPEGVVVGQMEKLGGQQWLASVQVPLLAGVSLRGHQAVLGLHLAQVMQRTVASSGDPQDFRRDLTVIGASLGLAFRITSGFRIYPQVGIGWTVRDRVTTSTPEWVDTEPPRPQSAQASVGFLLGGE